LVRGSVQMKRAGVAPALSLGSDPRHIRRDCRK
jgi:hypothetical protein